MVEGRTHRGVVGLLTMLAIVAVATPAALGRSAPAATAAGGCAGHVTREVHGTTVRAHSIRTGGMTCKSGKRLIRRFLRKADDNRSCRRASERPSPTRGCAVGRFHCWRGLARYCARPGHDVSWRE